MEESKQDGLSALDGKSRELVAAAANAIQKVDWTYDRSPDPEVRREGFKNMRAAVHSLDAVVTHGGNIRSEYAMDAVDAVKQHTLRTEAASAIWQHHAPKMASETKEYYRPDWFYPERLHNHSWDVGKITSMGQEYGAAGGLSHQGTQANPSEIERNSKVAEDKEVRKARQNVERRQEQHWSDKIASGRQARIAEGAAAGLTDEQAQRQKMGAAAGMAAAGVLAVSIASAPTANAQDIGFLERMSQERNQTAHQTIAPLPAAPERLQAPPQRLTCMGTDAWQPVRAQPSHGGSVIGATQPQVAATGRTINGYDEINFNGHAGYIPSSTVRPYQSPVNPSVKCSVSGVRDNGAPVFHYGMGAG